MILDALAQWRRYAAIHPGFPQAFEALSRPGLSTLSAGRHELDDTRMYLLVDDRAGRAHDGARLEAHRAYIDVQVTMEGGEEIGWRPLGACRHPAGQFDDQQDICFFDDRPETWVAVPPQHFAIFFPEDAHAPLGGSGALRKAIVKIAVRW